MAGLRAGSAALGRPRRFAHDLELLPGRREAVRITECVEICECALDGSCALDRNRCGDKPRRAGGEIGLHALARSCLEPLEPSRLRRGRLAGVRNSRKRCCRNRQQNHEPRSVYVALLSNVFEQGDGAIPNLPGTLARAEMSGSGFCGASKKADDGTRTHDLLHILGKLAAFAPAPARPLKADIWLVSPRPTEQERTRTNYKRDHRDHAA